MKNLNRIHMTPEEKLADNTETSAGLLQDIKEKLDNLKPKDIQRMSLEGISHLTLKGDKGDKPTEEELLNLIKPLIPEPIPGKDAEPVDEDKIIAEVLSKIPKPKDGKDGKSIVGEKGESGSPDTGEIIIKKLSPLKNVLNFQILTNVPDFVTSRELGRGGGGGGQQIVYRDVNATQISAYVTDLQFGTGLSTTYSSGKITVNSTADLSVTLADVSTNSLTTPNSLYTMTFGIPVEFKTSGGTSALLITEATGGVTTGVSLTSPLLIGGTAVGSNIIYKSTIGIGTVTGIAHQFVGGTNGGTVAMTVLNNGNVGIGTTVPGFPLQVNSTAANRFAVESTGHVHIGEPTGTNYANSIFNISANEPALNYGATINIEDTRAVATGIGSRILMGSTYDTGLLTGGVNFGAYKENATPGNYAYSFTIGTRANGRNITEKMRIDSAGNVGIGTTSPLQKLDITGGSMRLDNTTGTTPTGIIYKGALPFISDFNYGNNGTVTTNGNNLFVGINAGNLTMGSTATTVNDASYNTAVGYGALHLNTTGNSNTALGFNALAANTTGNNNFGLGHSALALNQTGTGNVAVGFAVLASNISGGSNTGIGSSALYSNTGSSNIGVGTQALYFGTGSHNVAIGLQAMYSAGNTSFNTAVGEAALYNITTGASNIGIGYFAGLYANVTTVNQTSGTSIYIGNNTKALADGDANEIVIGNATTGLGSNTVTLGNASIVTTALRGNVGIGTTGPTAPLDVKGLLTSGSTGLVLRNGDGSTGVGGNTQITFGFNNTVQYPSFIRTRHNSSATNNAIDFYTGDGTANGVFPTNAVLGMSINNGNVGIGTTSPLKPLDVAGSARITGTASSTLTGTADPTASTTLVGTGTLFTTELVIGDRITINAETRTVTAIASATSLTVDTAFTDTAPASITKLPSIFTTRLSSNAIGILQNDLGWVGIGKVPTVELDVFGSLSIGGIATLGGGVIFTSGATRVIYVSGFTNQLQIDGASLALNSGSGGRVGIGLSTITAALHLKAGTATASTAPLKFTTGTLLTAAEAGAVEFLTDSYYATTTTGAIRRMIVAGNTGRSAGAVGAVASVATYTLGATDASFVVSMNVLVTTATIHNFNCECAYTDEGNTPRVLTFSFSTLAGAFLNAIINTAGAVPYEGVPLHIRCKASTAITLRTQAAGTYTTIVYNVEGVISQVA